MEIFPYHITSHNKECNGCERNKRDIMISIYNQRRIITDIRIADIFITNSMALHLASTLLHNVNFNRQTVTAKQKKLVKRLTKLQYG